MQKIFNFLKKHQDGEIRYPRELEEKYRVTLKVLGTGSFAVVKECIEKETNKSYALKILSKKTLQGKEQILSSELDILKKVRHPHIISMHALYESKEGIFIVSDLASGGELFEQLLLKGSYTEKDAANLVKQLLEGVDYLHDMEIVHRDLKPENLLFKDKSENSDIMITDFGLSKIITNKNDLLLTACGTPGYVAPEVLLQTGHGKPVDIWSLGVITYTMLCGYTPFWGEDQSALFDSIISGVYEYEEEYWSEISNPATDLIDRMLTYDPYKRITAKEALKHPWFESAGNADIYEHVRDNLSAREKFKRAVNAIQGFNRIRKNLNSSVNLIGNDDDGNRQSIVEKETTITTTATVTVTVTEHQEEQQQNRKVEGNKIGKERKEENRDIDIDVKEVENVSKVTAEVS